MSGIDTDTNTDVCTETSGGNIIAFLNTVTFGLLTRLRFVLKILRYNSLIYAQLFTNCEIRKNVGWPSIGLILIQYLSSIELVSSKYRPGINLVSKWYHLVSDVKSIKYQLSIGRVSTWYQPGISRVSTKDAVVSTRDRNHWPTSSIALKDL